MTETITLPGGQVVESPWPLLLTILNLPQLSIMISLQVSANRALAASATSRRGNCRCRTAWTRSWPRSTRPPRTDKEQA